MSTVRSTISTLNRWHKPEEELIVFWWSKSDVEEIIDKNLTGDQWEELISHSDDVDTSEVIDSMHEFLKYNGSDLYTKEESN